jgi:hypothetical protein
MSDSVITAHFGAMQQERGVAVSTGRIIAMLIAARGIPVTPLRLRCMTTAERFAEVFATLHT